MNTSFPRRGSPARLASVFTTSLSLALAGPLAAQQPAGDLDRTLSTLAAGGPREAGPMTPVTLTDLGIELLPVPAGTFLMGSPRSDLLRYTDEPDQATVSLTRGFWLGKTEVTQGQWEALMGANPSRFSQLGANAPVESVAWADAMAFCAKLTAREQAAGRLPAGHVYMLPTEAQWEYACRAGTLEPHAGDLDAMAWYSRNSGITTEVVAQKQPNAWGFYDMHGNVWEWAYDWHRSGLLGRPAKEGEEELGEIDPAGPTTGERRVLRGGAFNMPEAAARSAYRLRLPPTDAKYTIGFRIALSVPPDPQPEPPPRLRRQRPPEPEAAAAPPPDAAAVAPVPKAY